MQLVLLAQEQGDELARELSQVDVNTLALIGGLIVPIITAIITTKLAASSLKAIITAVLAVVAGLIAVAIEHQGAIDWEVWASSIIQASITAWASYYGFWKPTQIAPKTQDATHNFGIGPSEAKAAA